MTSESGTVHFLLQKHNNFILLRQPTFGQQETLPQPLTQAQRQPQLIGVT